MVPNESYPRPVLIIFSILAALQVLTGGSVLADVIGAQTAGLIILAVAAVQTGMSFYVQGVVVPASRVVARRASDGDVVAGDASALPTGNQVAVVPASAYKAAGGDIEYP